MTDHERWTKQAVAFELRKLEHGGHVDPLPLKPEVIAPAPDLSAGLRRQFPIEYQRTGKDSGAGLLSAAALCFGFVVVIVWAVLS